MCVMSEKPDNNTPRYLFRSEHDRVIVGVCGGFGEFFGIDPVIIRILFILFTIFGGSGVVIYIICWLAIPSESSLDNNPTEETVKRNAHEMGKEIHAAWSRRSARRYYGGGCLILVGLVFLLANFGLIAIGLFVRLWPLLLILLGLLMLSNAARRK